MEKKNSLTKIIHIRHEADSNITPTNIKKTRNTEEMNEDPNFTNKNAAICRQIL